MKKDFEDYFIIIQFNISKNFKNDFSLLKLSKFSANCIRENGGLSTYKYNNYSINQFRGSKDHMLYKL